MIIFSKIMSHASKYLLFLLLCFIQNVHSMNFFSYVANSPVEKSIDNSVKNCNYSNNELLLIENCLEKKHELTFHNAFSDFALYSRIAGGGGFLGGLFRFSEAIRPAPQGYEEEASWLSEENRKRALQNIKNSFFLLSLKPPINEDIIRTYTKIK